MPKKDFMLINGRKYSSRLFHCFGSKYTKLNLDLVVNLIKESGTEFIVFNTHNVFDIKRKGDLKVGFSSITLSEIGEMIDLSKYTLLNNINNPKNWREAVARAVKSFEISKNKIIKLEVLNSDFKTSFDKEVIKAADVLVKKGYEVMPLISCNLRTAKKLESIGCCLLRIMGSPIGSFRGIGDMKAAETIFKEIKIPVIIDGGIGKPQHVIDAMSIGASGVLVNSSLFAAKDPILMAKAMKHAVISGRSCYLEKVMGVC